MNNVAKLDYFGGTGQISVNGRPIATVKYSIRAIQSLRDNGSGEHIPGPKNIIGNIVILNWEAELTGFLAGTVLTLKLNDGRTWPFAIQSGDPFNGYQCISQGDFEQ